MITALRKSGAIIIGKDDNAPNLHIQLSQSPLFRVTRIREMSPPPAEVRGLSGRGRHGCRAPGGTEWAVGAHSRRALQVVGFKPSLGRIPFDILQRV
jgi:hypothetical protein